jgi:hypothetical protein
MLPVNDDQNTHNWRKGSMVVVWVHLTPSGLKLFKRQFFTVDANGGRVLTKDIFLVV